MISARYTLQAALDRTANNLLGSAPRHILVNYYQPLGGALVAREIIEYI